MQQFEFAHQFLGFFQLWLFFLATLYVPNPAILTESSAFSASKIVLVIVSKVLSASALLRFKAPDNLTTNCFVHFSSGFIRLFTIFIKSIDKSSFF